MTIKAAKAYLRPLGIVITKTAYGEYRVNFKGGREETAYYTNDLKDAVGTGAAMTKWGRENPRMCRKSRKGKRRYKARKRRGGR